MNDLNQQVITPDKKLQATMQRHGITLRIAQGEYDLDQVYQLTYECYLREGYCSRNESRRLIHYPHLDHLAETAVLMIEDENHELIGTCSTTSDNRFGLHVDEDFAPECNRIRAEQTRLASSWRIAVDPHVRSGSSVVRLLIEGSIALWHSSRIETCLMTFNPCHERFYARYMNCTTIATRETIHGLSNAPAVLMRWDAMRCPFRTRFTPAITNSIH